MNDELLNQAVQVLGTVGGVALAVSLVVQFLIKPGLYARYGGEDVAKANQAYPFTVNVLSYVTAVILSSIGLFALNGLPTDGNAWATAGGNILVGALFATFGGIGIESIASNAKARFLSR